MSVKNVHTVHNENGWQNKYENSTKSFSTYDTKKGAQQIGRKKTIQNKSEHIIHE